MRSRVTKKKLYSIAIGTMFVQVERRRCSSVEQTAGTHRADEQVGNIHVDFHV